MKVNKAKSLKVAGKARPGKKEKIVNAYAYYIHIDEKIIEKCRKEGENAVTYTDVALNYKGTIVKINF